MFAEGLLPTTRAQVRNYLASHPDSDYQAVTRYAEALGDTYRSGKRATSNVDFAKKHAKPTKLPPKRAILNTESSYDIHSVADQGSAAEILAISQRTGNPYGGSPVTSTLSTPPSSYYHSQPGTPQQVAAPFRQLPPAEPVKKAPIPSGQSVVYCRICLAPGHSVCPWIPPETANQFFAEREKNFRQRREDGTLYTCPQGFNRPYGSTQIAQRRDGRASINVVQPSTDNAVLLAEPLVEADLAVEDIEDPPETGKDADDA